MAHDFEAVLSAFRAVSRGDRWKGYCPIHRGGAERNPSVSIAVRDGRILIRCHVCGKEATPAIVEALGFRMSDLFQDEPTRRRPVALKSTATYVYTDESGAPLYQSVRYDYQGGGKAFSQMRWDAAKGLWLPGLGSEPGTPGGAPTTRRVLYRLKDLVNAPGQGVIVVEGEAKADLISSWNLVAVCNVGGCGMGWNDSYSESLKGRRVVVLPDNDPPGFRHADRVVGSLVRHGVESVRLVLLPGLELSGDVIDWVKAGGTRELLLKLIKETVAWGPLA